jgi:hypothetical protein
MKSVTREPIRTRNPAADADGAEGRFVNSAFVNVNGEIVKLDGDFLFISGADEPDLPVLIQYRIAEPIGAPDRSV